MTQSIQWTALEQLPARDWIERIGHVEHGTFVHAVARAIRVLLLPIWERAHPRNRQIARAIDAATAYIDRPTENAKLHALAIAKACGKERERTFGFEHRTEEAARALIWAATRVSQEARQEALAEALDKIEEELVTRDAVAGVYDREREHRARIIDTLRQSGLHAPTIT